MLFGPPNVFADPFAASKHMCTMLFQLPLYSFAVAACVHKLGSFKYYRAREFIQSLLIQQAAMGRMPPARLVLAQSHLRAAGSGPIPEVLDAAQS